MDTKNFEKVKEMLCKEMDEIAKQGEISAGTLATVDTLAHAIKNIDKIIMCGEGNYSNYDGYSRTGGDSYGGGWMARGGYGDSYKMPYYSRDEGRIVDRLKAMMDEAHDDRERAAIRKAVDMLK